MLHAAKIDHGAAIGVGSRVRCREMMNDSDPHLPPLPSGHVHVWQFSLKVDRFALEACESILSTDERQRAERYARPELRRRFVVARATLRKLLGAYGGRPADRLRFAYGPAGKPELCENDGGGGGWNFNVSHSSDWTLIAVSPGGVGGSAVGVDLEKVQPLDYEAIGRGVLGESDMAALNQAPASVKADVFFRLWVRHEARAKALGVGLGTCVDVPVYDLDVGPEYRAALATAIPGVRIELFSR